MARERFSFDDTIEFDKDELKPNNDIHANHTGKFTFDDEVKEKKVAKPKKKKRKARPSSTSQKRAPLSKAKFNRDYNIPGPG